MDRTVDHLAAFAHLATLRRAAGAGQNATDEPNSLLEMLLNPDFVASPLGITGEVRRDDPSSYEDLPPLEDASDGDGSRPTTPRSSRDDMPVLEDEQTLPVDADDVPLASATTTASPVVSSGTTSASGVTAVARSARPLVGRTRTGATRTTAPSSSSAAGAEEDNGADSDSSLPSLQSVSDSSDDDDDYVSESDWDEEESLDDSDEESNLVSQMLEQAERVSADASRAPLAPTDSMDIEPDRSLDPIGFTASLQAYRNLLERARNLVPDIDARFHPPPDWVADLAMRATGADNDPERAKTLLAGMEEVPDDLVQRYEKLRTGNEEDVDGCAICREDLLAKVPPPTEDPVVVAHFVALPFHPDPDCIVAFPCAGKHLFHKDCLSPWLARKTTCPTCRFDIDPLSLTLQITRSIRDPGGHDHETGVLGPERVWQPPQSESLSDWLSAEEQAQDTGIPRTRPAVRMPEYPPLATTATATTGAPPPRPARPAGATLLADLFDSSPLFSPPSPAGQWDLNDGHNRLTTPSRNLQELSRRLIDIEARRLQLESDAMPILSGHRRTEVPARSPSAPPNPSAAALPPPSDLHLPLPHMNPSVFRELARHAERDFNNLLSPPPLNDASSGHPLASTHSDDPSAHLHNTPLVLSHPPTEIDVNVLAAQPTSHVHRGVGEHRLRRASPYASPSLTSSSTVPMPSSRGLDDLSNPSARETSQLFRTLSGPLSDIATSYMELARSTAALRGRLATTAAQLVPSLPRRYEDERDGTERRRETTLTTPTTSSYYSSIVVSSTSMTTVIADGHQIQDVRQHTEMRRNDTPSPGVHSTPQPGYNGHPDAPLPPSSADDAGASQLSDYNPADDLD
ncbi:hypothetical protein C8Q80DRAFT_1117421 [Daedaleopsis nitida]|nr:hypothetical protein C8Q80DRAFT_1117421 [Daedaleopsis nitida]